MLPRIPGRRLGGWSENAGTYGHETRLGAGWFRGLDASGQAKIAHLQVAICIEEEIGWFEIPMDHVRAVEGLERSEGLVHKVLGRV